MQVIHDGPDCTLVPNLSMRVFMHVSVCAHTHARMSSHTCVWQLVVVEGVNSNEEKAPHEELAGKVLVQTCHTWPSSPHL